MDLVRVSGHYDEELADDDFDVDEDYDEDEDVDEQGDKGPDFGDEEED